MDGYDFFELTGIDFDPPEKKAEVIKLKVNTTKAKYSISVGEASKKAENDAIIQFLDEKMPQFIQGAGTSAAFKTEAKKKTDKVKDNLLKQASVKYKSLNPSGNASNKISISEGEVKEAARARRLAFGTAKKVYEDVGFEIEKPLEIEEIKKLVPKFTSESNFKNVQDRLSSLRKLDKFYDLKFKGKEKVFDIYGFAAYLSSDIDDIEDFRNEDTKSLRELMKSFKVKFPGTTGNDTISLYNGLASLAETYIFKDDNTRNSYDKYLLYHCEQLELIYSELKQTDDSTLKDSGVANAYIDKIAEVIEDHDIAVAIYNMESGLLGKGVPYISEIRTYYIKCPACGLINKFQSQNEAKRSNECKFCHEHLYKSCPKCGNLVQRKADQCDCGYVFPNIPKFNKYISLAEDALNRGDLVEAEVYFKKAKNSAPDEKERSSAFASKLGKEKGKYDEQREKLDLFIQKNLYEKANNYLSEIMTKYPQMNISGYKKKISSVLDECKKRMNIAKTCSGKNKIDELLDILDFCADYSPACQILRTIPLQKCSLFTASADDKNSKVNLAWKATGERGVKFFIVRKEGKKAPLSISDGTLIVKEYSDTSFTDDSVVPGCWYSYALFVGRLGIYSEAALVSIAVLSMVQNIRCTQMGNSLHFDWKQPDNCESVTVSKVVDGKETIISQNARNNIDDKNLSFNKKHNYYFAASYGNAGVSQKAIFSIVPTVVIDNFRITHKHLKDNNYELSWTILQPGVDLKIMINGREEMQARSDMKKCSLSLNPDNFYTINVLAFSGGKWVSSDNEVLINTYLAFSFKSEITETATSAAGGGTGKVKIDIIPESNINSNVKEILYFVRVKKEINSPPPWVYEEEAKSASDGIKVDASALLQNNRISYSITAKKEMAYYISLYCCYKVNGHTVLSSPARRQVKRPLLANIIWGISKKFFGGAKLHIETKANRPITRRPHLWLCASNSGKLLLSENDPAAILVMDIGEKILDTPVESLSEEIDITGSISKGDKLFLFEKDIIPNEKYVTRWKAGFNGKL